jgi:hypothetical protein
MCIFKKKIELPATGLIPSPKDARDIQLSAVQASIPLTELPETHIIPFNLTILNQGNYPACVGFSCANIKAEKEREEQNLVDFDGKWIYEKCKELDGMPNLAGTWFRIGLKVLKDTGAKPKDQLETEAPKYKIGAYARVDDLTFDGLKKAIRQNGAILAGFKGSNPGWQTAYIRPPKSGEEIWGHATTLIGWNKDYIIGQNSWGESWGDKGKFYMGKDYLPYLIEAWAVLVDLPDDFVQTPKPKHSFAKDLKQGDNNVEVSWLQQCLKYLGVFPQIIDNTGYYGTITVQAVKLFQISYGLSQTGTINASDRSKLNSIFY